jgi:hypothetical protein
VHTSSPSPEALAVPAESPPKDPLEDVVRSAAPAAAFVQPTEGSRAAREAIDVEVVYPADARLDLTLNGDPVPMDFIGATSTLPSRGVSASRFVAVKLRPGPNVLDLHADPPGDAVPSSARVTCTGPAPRSPWG